MTGPAFSHEDDDVAVIIGSGAGGGTLANELSRRGLKCVILEAGRELADDEVVNDEYAMAAKASWQDRRIAAIPGQPMPFMGKAVGGTTIFWGAVASRFLDHDFRTASDYGAIAGANLLDWPITLDELNPYYALAERKLGVSGAAASGLPQLPENSHFKVLAEGARRIGYKNIIRPLAINSRPHDDRPACVQLGFCQSGCIVHAKWASNYAEIPKALATGRVESRTKATATHLEHSPAGLVTGVVYRDAQGKEVRQRARIVCVAGNAVETPRLLLHSTSSLFPDGIGNSSGELGRNYMTHTVGFSFAIHQGPVRMYEGSTLSAIVADEIAPDRSRGFVGGYHLEGLALGLPFTAVNLDPGGWGPDVTHYLDNYDNLSLIWICGEDLPQAGNSITLHASEADRHGVPLPVITKKDHANDTAMRHHAAGQAEKIARAVGAVAVRNAIPGGNGHNMGTARMSAKPGDGVVDRNGRSHDVRNLFIADGSQFASSSASNPTLTIVALAIRQADHIAKMVRQGSL